MAQPQLPLIDLANIMISSPQFYFIILPLKIFFFEAPLKIIFKTLYPLNLYLL